LAAAQNDLAYEEQVYAVAQVKYKQGNLSANALLDAQDTLDSAKRDVTSAQLDLYTAYHSYRQAVEQGLVGS
jgi:outer membrane protein TolC